MSHLGVHLIVCGAFFIIITGFFLFVCLFAMLKGQAGETDYKGKAEADLQLEKKQPSN